MAEQVVSQTFFHPAGGAEETSAPYISENADKKRNSHHVKGVVEQMANIGFKCRQIINRPFDDARNDELEDIGDNQTEQPDHYFASIFEQIGFDQQRGRASGNAGLTPFPGCHFSVRISRTLTSGCGRIIDGFGSPDTGIHSFPFLKP